MKQIPAFMVRELFNYDASTGVLIWRVRKAREAQKRFGEFWRAA
jgi:hypothetical protein